jgi:hypothetical protein
MQKLDFIKKIETITERLKSDEIVTIFQEGFKNPSKPYNYALLNPILFISKSQFDQIMLDPNLEPVMSLITGNTVYEEKVISTLPNIFRPTNGTNIVLDSNATNFFSFHKGLIDTLNVTKNLLSNEIIDNNNSQNLENGVLLFTVQIETEGLSTSQYIKIFSLLNELIKTIEKIYKFEESESEIVLLDSGSDTNLGLKTKVELAKSIFEIFKEIWDFITSFKYIRNEQKSNALLESLSIRKKIQKSVEEGILTEEEGKEYSHIIKTRTDNLIGLKVLPRELIIERQLIESKNLLNEYKIFLLENKKG